MRRNMPAYRSHDQRKHPSPHWEAPFVQVSYPESSRPEFVELPHPSVHLHDSEHEWTLQLHTVYRHGVADAWSR
jgi:hypothetical protein